MPTNYYHQDELAQRSIEYEQSKQMQDQVLDHHNFYAAPNMVQKI
jgi:hypothetical protein